MEDATQEVPQVEAEPTQAELDFEKAKGIVEPMAREGKTDDEMAVELVTVGGFAFKKAGRLLQKVLENAGIRLSAKDRLEQASELLLANDFAPSDWDEVIRAADYLATELDATDQKQALQAIRKFAKAQDIELPAKPKGKGGGGKTGFRSQIHAWMRENATATDAEFAEWMKGHGKKQALINYYTAQFQLARDMAASINAA